MFTNNDDDKNPQFLFQLTFTELLIKVASGEIDAKKIATQELNSRGLNLEGKWVGFKSNN